MRQLGDLFVFAQVVDFGGITAAARALGMPKSSVSKRVADLEQRLGVRLIARTSRTFRVTELGLEVHRHAKAMAAEAEAAALVVERLRGEPAGTVRLTASAATCQLGLTPLLPALADRFPAVQVVLHATNRYVDLVQEGFDLAIRAHYRPLIDSALVQRRLGVTTAVLVASPAYLARMGEPTAPEALSEHHGLLNVPSSTDARWLLLGADGAVVEARPMARLYADEPSTLIGAALAGLGVASLPHGYCQPHLQSGALRRLLPAWHAGQATVSLLAVHRRGVLPSVRAVQDYLVANLPAAMRLEP